MLTENLFLQEEVDREILSQALSTPANQLREGKIPFSYIRYKEVRAKLKKLAQNRIQAVLDLSGDKKRRRRLSKEILGVYSYPYESVAPMKIDTTKKLAFDLVAHDLLTDHLLNENGGTSEFARSQGLAGVDPSNYLASTRPWCDIEYWLEDRIRHAWRANGLTREDIEVKNHYNVYRKQFTSTSIICLPAVLILENNNISIIDIDSAQGTNHQEPDHDRLTYFPIEVIQKYAQELR